MFQRIHYFTVDIGREVLRLFAYLIETLYHYFE